MRPGADDIVIGPAGTADLPAVRHLLESHQLPLDDIDSLVDTMIVARDRGAVVGVAALELYDDGALLRSVAVAADAQGHRLGHRLTNAALGVAQSREVPAVFLLTTTAERFFPRFGFERISRADVPASVQMSVEFRSACPRSATAMRRDLELRTPNSEPRTPNPEPRTSNLELSTEPELEPRSENRET